VIDTPISEEGFVGAAFGAAWMGERPIAELQFADFVSCPFDQIVTVGAKTHWRSGIALPVVIRLPTGGGVRGGPFHASSPEGWFIGVAGLKVVCPGTVEDAYGLLRSAIEDDDPVLYFEHKALYRRLKAPQPDAAFRVDIGRAKVVRKGSDVTVVTYGSGVTLALEVAEQLADSASVEVVDLRTVWPIDAGTLLESVARTSRALVLQEAAQSIGVADSVVSLIAREGFALLDAPVAVVAAPDSPIPYAPELEDAYLPSAAGLKSALENLLAY
jgi:2-oxoisovalerate dehydrogenase E1 component beta subunit